MAVCSKFMVNSSEFARMRVLIPFIFTFASSSSSSSFHFIVLCIQHSHVCNVYVAHKYSPITLCMRRYLLLLPLKLLFIIDNLSFILLSKTFKVRGVRLNACVSEA